MSSNDAYNGSDCGKQPAYKCYAFELAKVGLKPPLGTPPVATQSQKKVRRKSDALRKSCSLPSIRVTEAFAARVQSCANKSGKKQSEFIHDAIVTHIAKVDRIYEDYKQRIYVPDYGLIVAINACGNLLNQIARGIWLANVNATHVEICKVYLALIEIHKKLNDAIPYTVVCKKLEDLEGVDDR